MSYLLLTLAVVLDMVAFVVGAGRDINCYFMKMFLLKV